MDADVQSDVAKAANQSEIHSLQHESERPNEGTSALSSSRLIATAAGNAVASSVSSTSQDEASSSAAVDSEIQRVKKRRRRMEDLGFSSPGPAFFAMSVSSDAGSDSDATAAAADGSRISRRSRISGTTGLRVASSTSNNGTSQSHVSRASGSTSRSSSPIRLLLKTAAPHAKPSTNGSSSAANNLAKHPPTKSIFRNWDPMSVSGHRANGHNIVALQRESKAKRKSAAESSTPRRNGDSVPSDEDDGDEDDESIDDSDVGDVSASQARRQSRTRRASSRLQDYDERFSDRPSSPLKQRKGSLSSSKRDDLRLISSPARASSRSAGPSSYDAMRNAQPTASDPRSARIQDLTNARRREMDVVYKEHDMLVRELFHLRKFVTLFGFDPEVALQDHSDVFERFRMEYDLPTLLSGSKGRATRRLVSAKRGHLALPSVEASSSSSVSKQSNGVSSSVLGKATAVAETANGSVAEQQPVKRGRGRPRKVPVPAVELSDAVTDEDEEDLPQPKKRGRKSKAELLALQKRQTTSSSRSPSLSSDQTTVIVSQIKRPRGRPPKHTYAPRKPVELERIDGIPRLRVLRPGNLPAAPRHGHSLSAYLGSWFTTGEIVSGSGDWEVVTADLLRAREEREAALYGRIDELRSEGLLQSREEALHRSQQSRVREAERRQTAWDAILARIGTSAAQRRADLRVKTALAKRVARMVQGYWDERLGRGEKHRKAEERRIRALAKWTVREVRKQWKLAVNVVRAQRVAREKQEKDRVGREQLKSILEQSTQVLGQQQKTLLELGAAHESESDESDLESDSSEEDDDDDDSDDDGEVALFEDASVQSTQADDDEPVSDANSSHDSDLSLSDASAEDSDEDDSDDDIAFGSLSQLLLPRSPKRTSEKNDASMLSPPSLKVDGKIELLGEPTDDKMPDLNADAQPPQTTMTTLSTAAEESELLGASSQSGGQDEEDDDDDADDDDDEVGVEVDGERVDEDAELERKMWEDDESESDEDEELAAEADMPIEELMKKYGYGDAEAKSGPEPEEGQSAPDMRSHTNGTKHSKNEVASTSDYSQSDQEDVVDNDDEEDLSSTSMSLRPSRSRTAASTPSGEVTPGIKVKPPFLLRGTLRPYQQIGFEWLVNLYNNGSNGILADEMGLGKTIQTIALLGHLACDKGVWGPHLVVAPTSVMLNWEVEFKKFLPGFKILSYYGSQRERKEKRKGWNTENSFNVCITSYQLILADQHILRRKPWKYLVLDEAHHIKNFRSQRWQTLLGFNSQRRLLLTGTPLQNNLMDLWSLMYFLMPNGVTNAEGVVNSGFASMKEFQQWFSNPLDRAVENAGLGTASEEMDNETKGMVSKLHTLLRPYLLRRLKSEVEREMPNKYEHVIKCRLSKRQQFLYNDFMSRAKTRESLASGNYLSIINCLMQLRKVCNHPDLFEQRPIVTSFAMDRSAVADYEIKELLVRRNLLHTDAADDRVDLDVLNLSFNTRSRAHLTPIFTRSLSKLDASDKLPFASGPIVQAGAIDTWTVEGYAQSMAQKQQAERAARWQHVARINRLRCQGTAPHLFDRDSLDLVDKLGPGRRLFPFSAVCEDRKTFLNRCDAVHRAILGLDDRRAAVQGFIDRFAFVTPRAVSTDMPKWALPGLSYDRIPPDALDEGFDTLHAPAVKLQIAFPDASLLQYDCGKLQELAKLMDQCKYGTHRILIFTQMTKILDILEIWLNFNGFNYLRLDGQTKVEDRQALTEKFNRDDRIKAFILSTRSGGLGINLTGADMVLFWDLDWNFQIEAQCMDRAHRIGQTRDVHIYRFVSEHTIEENMLKKSHEKRLLDAMVIQDGQFTTEGLSKMSWIESMFDEGSRSIAGVRVGGGGGSDATATAAPTSTNDRRIEMAMDAAEDEEDARAAQTARAEIHVIDDEFADEMDMRASQQQPQPDDGGVATMATRSGADGELEEEVAVLDGDEGKYDEEEMEEEGGTVDDYMLRRVDADWEFFSTV